MCPCGWRLGSSSELPSGRNAMAPSNESTGTTAPQTEQNERGLPGDGGYRVTRSSPRSQRKPRASPPAKVANAAPCALRHLEQWQ